MHRPPHQSRSARGYCLLALLLVPTLAAQSSGTAVREPHHFLRTYIDFSEKEILQTERGAAIAKLLETPLKREIAVFGIVWIDAPIDFYLEKYEDIENFERGAGVVEIGKFSEPPRAEDFAGLTIPERDMRAIPECKLGDCDVKVSEENLRRLQQEVDWDAPDAPDQAREIVVEMALSYLQAYRRGGNDELAVYRDKKRPNFVASEFQGLLQNSPYVPVYLPDFHRYLLEYPNAALARSREFFYWAKNDFGLQPIIRLNHVTLYRRTDGPDSSAVIASKQLYCSHYFHTALELRYLAKDTARPDARGFFLMTLNRSRADGLTGFQGLFVRGRVRDRTRDGLHSHLEATKRNIELAYQRKIAAESSR